MNDTRSILWRGCFNVAIVIIIFIPIILFYYLGDPTVRGFFCNDESLRHPYLPSTVPAPPLYFVGFALPLLTIAVVELLGRRTLLQEGSIVWGRYTIPAYAVSVFFIFVGYLFGTVVTQCLTDVTKYTVGRQRPHFFAVCNPDFSSLTCGNESNPIYVTNYVCRGNKGIFGDDPAELAFRLREARVSFVSGHSSFSFQIAVFLVIYLQACVVYKGKKSILIVPFFQFLFITAALFVAISRVMDFKHHPGDVIAGGLLGTLVQVLNTVFVMKLFKRKPERKIAIEDYGYPAHNGATASSVEDGIPNVGNNSNQHIGANIPAVNFNNLNSVNTHDQFNRPL